ncbi:MAG: DUF1638 domain-containing protein [Clostridiales bacterium]
MGKTKIIACEMLRPEVEYLVSELGLNNEIIWIEPALHVTPQLLKERLQEVLDSFANTDCQRVLMPFGDCGGAVAGLKSGNFELVIPKVDDCLTLMLGSLKKRQELSMEMPTFYLTLGWITQEKNIIADYHNMVKNYGQETADMLKETMFGNYNRVALIDTGVGDSNALLSYGKPLKEIFGFNEYPVKGTTEYLKRLLTGPWSSDLFRIIPPFGCA